MGYVFFLFFIAVAWAFIVLIPKSQSHSPRFTISRSVMPTARSGRMTCGNCRGTGLDGFGIMPDSIECEGCNGRGSIEIDPNAKVMTLEEVIKFMGNKE